MPGKKAVTRYVIQYVQVILIYHAPRFTARTS